MYKEKHMKEKHTKETMESPEMRTLKLDPKHTSISSLKRAGAGLYSGSSTSL